MENYWSVDGQFVIDKNAFVAADDSAVLRGYGVFDFLMTYHRRPFFLKEHISRLLNSARLIWLDVRYSEEEICRIVDETIAKNPHLPEAYVRIVYTGGVSSGGASSGGFSGGGAHLGSNGKLIVYVTPKSELPEWWYIDGAKVITANVERYIPEAKSLDYMNAVIASARAKTEDAIESLYIDRRNRILEGTTTNVFFFRGQKLITPGTDILAGITREVILRHIPAVRNKFQIEVRDVDQSELTTVDEMFITASNKEIVPIVKVDDLTIGNGTAGPRTKEVMKLFRRFTTAYGKGLG